MLSGPRGPAEYLALARNSGHENDLLRLVDSPYPFVWQALAENPRTPPEALIRLCSRTSGPWNDNRLLYLLALHPRADRVVLEVLVAAVSVRLRAGGRPYAAVLALAERAELDVDDVRPLGSLPGASARLRRGIAARLGP